MSDQSQDPITRIHERLDQIMERQGEIGEAVARIETRCGPCGTLVTKHEQAIYGNGQSGLITRITANEERLKANEEGRTDTLSIKGVVTLIGAVGTLAGAIGGAMALLVK